MASIVLAAGLMEIRGRPGEISQRVEGPGLGSLIVAVRRLFSVEAGREVVTAIRAAIATHGVITPTLYAIHGVVIIRCTTVRAGGLTESIVIIVLT